VNEIEALLVERRGYVARKLNARVAAVDAALRALGYEVTETASVERGEETTSRKKTISRKRG